MRESEYLEGNEQLIGILKDLPAFENLKDESIEKLIRFCKLRSYSSKEAIIEEGQTDKSVYLLISGCVSISKANSLITSLNQPGELFGEMSFIAEEPKPRSANVHSDEDTTCLAFDGDYLERIDIEGKEAFQASIYRMFAQILANRLRITTQEYIKSKQEIETLNKRLKQAWSK